MSAQPQQNPSGVLPSLLAALEGGSVKVIDLTTPLSSEIPTLELPEPFANLIDFSLDYQSQYDAPGPFWKHANIHTGEHIGTHVDAPVHWVTGKDGHDVAELPPQRLVGPAVVLDFVAETENNPDLLIDVEHITAWERQHGTFPHNAWLLLRTGWSSRGNDREAFMNNDENGPHWPGFTAQCAEWLAQRPEVSGVGVETVGIDAGQAGAINPPFPMHYYLLGHDTYGLTLLKNLDQLPALGAVIVVSPLPIVGGTGSPARVFALVE